MPDFNTEIAEKAHAKNLRWDIPHPDGTVIVTTLFVAHPKAKHVAERNLIVVLQKMADIEQHVANHYGIGKRIRDGQRIRKYCWPRQVAMALCCEVGTMSEAARFWDKDPTTIRNAIRNQSSNNILRRDFNKLRVELAHIIRVDR